ncbi:cathepsin O [Trichonephila inaurata madagascariensis]|uniref:Cathepsin O n=1 Tax=Trichonephila inaurata madagascariensis TaxID=2747483 RepID=A0A8X7BVT6_9ARAC|nr:cathepsin O [Trichonephila inaurata madagascariensis]
MSLLAALHLAISSSLLLFVLSNDGTPSNEIFNRFSDYIRRFNKSYEYGTMEYKKRESIFEQTLRRIEWLNKHRNSSQAALYGINRYSDLTPEEFKNYTHLVKINNTGKKPHLLKSKLSGDPKVLKDLPKRVDWREKKVVTPVNNQENCGACWAFSSVETIETMYALKTGVLEQWSVQQVIDCAAAPNRGCGGGDTCLTVEWLYESQAKIVLAEDYPFTGETGECKQDVKSAKTVSIAKNFTCDSFVGEEYLMLLHLAHHGPLIAAVDATGWQDYLGGIIQYNCDSERNHAVQIVGYDLTGEIPYYIVRNSWGTEFGNDGYLNIIIGKNMCRIAEEVSAVDVI